MTLESGAGPIYSLALSPDGKTLATAGGDGQILLRDANNGRPIQTIHVEPSRAWVNQVVFTPDGRHLITGNANGTIYVLRLANAAQDVGPRPMPIGSLGAAVDHPSNEGRSETKTGIPK